MPAKRARATWVYDNPPPDFTGFEISYQSTYPAFGGPYVFPLGVGEREHAFGPLPQVATGPLAFDVWVYTVDAANQKTGVQIGGNIQIPPSDEPPPGVTGGSVTLEDM